jgi:hypothetical protein
VRADPMSNVTPVQQKMRETFVIDVLDSQAKLDVLAKELAAKRAAATPEEATRLQALEQRLIGGGGGGGRGGRGGGGGAPAAPGQAPQPPAVRARLNSLLGPFTISGATTGSLMGPTTTQRATLEEAKKDLAAIEKAVKR